MANLVSLLAFSVLIAAQFWAVIFARTGFPGGPDDDPSSVTTPAGTRLIHRMA